MMHPDFVIIGAMKCGTSTLAAQLGAQDGIFMTDPKEPNYFSDDAVYAKGAEWYASLFSSAAPGDIRGEASTHYTKRPDYPETLPRMRSALVAPRLVYMIRNPMTRLVSHYIHEWSEARISSSLDKVIDDHAPLVDYGLYGWQVEPFVEAYGRDAILLTSLERLKAEPDAELSRIAKHIGHAGAVHWSDDVGQENVSAERIRKFPFYDIIVKSTVGTTLRRALIPSGLRRRIREARQMTERPDIPDAHRKALEAKFIADRQMLAEYFPADPSLDLAYPFAQ